MSGVDALFLEPIAQDLYAKKVPTVLVHVQATRGSAPRERSAIMLVTKDQVLGTVGGGHLEYKAIEQARGMLSEPDFAGPVVHRYPLGAALGQCCGGEMTLSFKLMDTQDISDLACQIQGLKTLYLFGSGHVGRAIIDVICHLPLKVIWVDSRDEMNQGDLTFPLNLPRHIVTECTDTPETVLLSAKLGDICLIMTHSHALDEKIVLAALKQPHLAYIGLIGSLTKRRMFEHRLKRYGISDLDLNRLICPIGIHADLKVLDVDSAYKAMSKLPAVIAIDVAAQLVRHL